MIRGRVDQRLRPVVRVDVIAAGGGTEQFTAILDTGFSGFLSLPADAIARLGFIPGPQTTVTLATGVRTRIRSWSGFALWHGRRRPIAVLETGGEPLLGMSMVEGSHVSMDAQVAGVVAIDEIA